MTISSSIRKAGPFTGNGASAVFPFAFKVFKTSEVLVVRTVVTTGASTTLTMGTHYSVTLNADQNANPGGNVTLSSILAVGFTLKLTSRVPNLQPTDLTNAGGFYPTVINDSLDRATIQIQQLVEQVEQLAGGSLIVAPSEPTGGSSLSLNYAGPLVSGALFAGTAGLPDNAVITSVAVASGGVAQVQFPTTEQTLNQKNIHMSVTAASSGSGGLPEAVAAGEWVPSPNKEPLAEGKFMGAYWGDYTSYKGLGIVSTDSLGVKTPEAYWSLDYLTQPDMMGGNVAAGQQRIPLAKQLSHLFYAFFFPNCSYAEWIRFLPYMEIPPPSVYGTIEDAVAKGGVNWGDWVSGASYATNDIVLRNGVYYAALCPSTGKDPYWEQDGVSSEWINGAYGDPTGGAVIPVKYDGMTPTVPLEPGVGYKGFVYMGTRRPFTTMAGMMAQPAGIGPGTVWKTPDGAFWCGLTWVGYHDPNGLGSTAWGFHDGSYHTKGAGDEAATVSAHRRIYWRAVIPRGALVPTDTGTWQWFLAKLPALRAANPSLKVILSLGGWSRSHYMGVAFHDATMRQACIDSCLAYCHKGLSDGIDLDWETPGGNGPLHNVVNNVWPDNPTYAAQRAAFTADPTVNQWDKQAYFYFISGVKGAFEAYQAGGGRYLEVTCAIVPGDYALYNVMDAFPYMDHIMLMSYIFYGTWQADILPFAGLYKANPGDQTLLSVHGFAERVTNAVVGTELGPLGTVNAANGVATAWAGGTFPLQTPKSKVILGTTSNGAGYLSNDFAATPVPGGYHISGHNAGLAPAYKSLEFGGVAGFHDCEEIYHRYLIGQFQRYWDPVSKTAMYSGVVSGQTVVFSADDVTGYWHKANYAVENGYGGMMCWELSGDTKHSPAVWDPTYNLSARVTDANGKQFNNVDTLVSVLNNGGGGGGVSTGAGDVVLSRSATTSAGSVSFAQRTVANLGAASIKINYEVMP